MPSKPIETMDNDFQGYSLEYNFQQPSPYQASLNSSCSPDVSANGRLLMLSGHIFDIIAGITDTQPRALGNNDTFDHLQDLKNAYQERKRYINWQYFVGISQRRRYNTGMSYLSLNAAYTSSIGSMNRGCSRTSL